MLLWIWRIVVLFLLLEIAYPSEGKAANQPLLVLDAAASEIAGKSVSVHCETSYPQWQSMVRSVAANAEASLVLAYTIPSTPIVYLSPRACTTLTAAYRTTLEDAGYREFSLALLSLAHESIHQRGVVDEAQTECLAMPLVKKMAMKHFRLKAKVYKYVRAGKLWKRTLTVNPTIAKIEQWVRFWHNQKPANYQGVC